jgi:selenocysteine lyase/cysteine desulfurase
MTPAEVRELFPILSERAYLFSGGIAPASTPMLAALEHHLATLTHNTGDLYQGFMDETRAVRGRFAALMGADENEIVVNDSTSAGSSLAISLIEPRPGGNVVFDGFPYPSSVYPWMLPPRDVLERRFVEPRDGLIHYEDMERAIDDNTVAVSVSHVTPAQGFRHDIGALAEIAHAHGALLLVDGAQSAGGVNIDLHDCGVDFFSTTAMKWLLGPAGVGFFYVAKRHLDRQPPTAGWVSTTHTDMENLQLLPSAERFQLGMPNLMGVAATLPGVDILLETGMDVVEAHVLDLTGYCIEGLHERGITVRTPADPTKRGGVIAAEFDDAEPLQAFLTTQGVDTYCLRNLFRVDPHIFNDRTDIDRLFAGIDAFRANR